MVPERPAPAGSPTVTVTVCTHNSSPYLEATLESVLCQTWRDFELIVVDDGSTNGCVERIAPLCADPRVRVVRQPHGGLGAARQRSLDEARGTWMAIVDHDDLWDAGKLQAQVAALQARPDAGLVFCGTRLLGPDGRLTGTVPDTEALRGVDLDAGAGLLALLERGCFIDVSSVMAPTSVLRAVGGFNPSLEYVEDLDLWLRLAARYPMVHVERVLSTRRVHPGQFTSTHADVALREQGQLLRQYWRQASYPTSTRQHIADYMSGQHCECARRLWTTARCTHAVRAAAGAPSWPGGTRAAAAYWAKRTSVGRTTIDAVARVRTAPAGVPLGAGHEATPLASIWFDATPLGAAETGYFNLTLELLRSVLRRYGSRVPIHVDVPRAVARRLPYWLGPDADRLHLHRLGDVNREPTRQSWWRPDGGGCVEVLIWHGRYRFARSRRAVVLPDVTPRTIPGCHTGDTLQDFEALLAYALPRADTILTVSNHSRDDIVTHLRANPLAVHVMPHGVQPRFDPHLKIAPVPASLGLTRPYVLVVGTIEPRKNLPRLVHAFESLVGADEHRDLELAIAGPQGWDDQLGSIVASSPARSRIRMLGFVDGEHLPSLYAHAEVLAYPSLYEGYGLPVLEAMCCGGVVVASRVSSLPEVLGEAGGYVDPTSVQDIARGLHDALSLSPTARDRCRAAARARATELLARWDAYDPLAHLVP